MILTVTLNAALDITYRVPSLVPHQTHRVSEVHAQAGGKGINVARMLFDTLSHPTTVTGLVGGITGQAIRADLAELKVKDKLLDTGVESRRTVAVVAEDTGDATMFSEPGPRLRKAHWQAFTEHFAKLAKRAAVVVMSGSIPPGLPVDAYAQLLAACPDQVPTIVDADGEALRLAVAAGPTVVKPNLAELEAATGLTDPVAGARQLMAAGAGAVAVSAGPEGMLAVTADSVLKATLPERLAGNPTGAGDACVAGLAAGLKAGISWHDMLRNATAMSAAAVLYPVAGAFSGPVYLDQLFKVRVRPLLTLS